jgi:hypothetical protein
MWVNVRTGSVLVNRNLLFERKNRHLLYPYFACSQDMSSTLAILRAGRVGTEEVPGSQTVPKKAVQRACHVA